MLQDDALTGHRFRFWQAQNLEHGRRNVCQSAFVQLAVGVLFADDQKWHRIGGVCGERRAVLLIHPVGVAVVGGQQNGAVHRQDLLHHLAYAAVHRLYRLDCRCVRPCRS